MLRGTDIRVTFGRATILDGVSFAVAPGEVVAVLGPNGAGKSTLLSVLSGALSPTAGRAVLAGRPLAEWPPQLLARQRAVLPQHVVLDFAFRVLEVVLLGRSSYAGLSSRDQDISVAAECLAEMEVEHLMDRIYPTLSGGEQQRVQMARILAQVQFTEAANGNDRYLLLDEPTSSLDIAHQHMTLKTARRAAQRGIGVLAVLHDLNLASMYADRLVVLHQGRLVADGAPVDVLNETLISETFDLAVSISRHPIRGCPQVIAN